MKIRITFTLDAIDRAAIAGHYGLDRADYRACLSFLEAAALADLQQIVSEHQETKHEDRTPTESEEI